MMADIIKIVIKGSSGYCCADEAYNDKVTITPESISYEYIPVMESEINPKRKWSYKTNSPIFQTWYSDVVAMIPGYFVGKITHFCTDIGGIEFNLTYSDKTKFKKICWVPGDDFKELFAAIRVMVPEGECTPVVLMTSKDYEDEEEE